MNISSYFKEAIDKKASDVHLAAGSIPALRIGGDLIKLSDKKLSNKELTEAIRGLVSRDVWENFKVKKEFDFSEEFSGSRFRVNLHYQEGKIGLSARLISNHIPTPEEIDINETIYNLTHLRDGLIIVTGPSGSGKSTTLASMINIVNNERRAHIITIEDPIEYIFEEKQSIIEQRELGHDTSSFASALKYALRQDPNVIMVGEMRDLETVKSVLTAAETGHLVMSTLHTAMAPETISRIVDVFPAHQQQQILNQLSSVLRAVVAQEIIPGTDGKMVVAREIMINNNAISNLIRRNQISQIYTSIETGSQYGMITMNKAIMKLEKEGRISKEVAKTRMRDLETQSVYY